MTNATLVSKQIKEHSYSWQPGKFPFEVTVDFGWLKTPQDSVQIFLSSQN